MIGPSDQSLPIPKDTVTPFPGPDLISRNGTVNRNMEVFPTPYQKFSWTFAKGTLIVLTTTNCNFLLKMNHTANYVER